MVRNYQSLGSGPWTYEVLTWAHVQSRVVRCGWHGGRSRKEFLYLPSMLTVPTMSSGRLRSDLSLLCPGRCLHPLEVMLERFSNAFLGLRGATAAIRGAACKLR